MQVFKYGNNLAVRLPTTIVGTLALKEGDDVEIHAVDQRTLKIKKRVNAREALKQLRKFRGVLPANFKFNQLRAN